MKLRVRESVRKQEREREPGRNAKLCVCKIQQPLFSAAFILSLIFSNSNPLSPPSLFGFISVFLFNAAPFLSPSHRNASCPASGGAHSSLHDDDDGGGDGDGDHHQSEMSCLQNEKRFFETKRERNGREERVRGREWLRTLLLAYTYNQWESRVP